MKTTTGAILCLAYILGLLSTLLLLPPASWTLHFILASGIGVLGIGAAAIVPRCWRTGPNAVGWLMAAIAGFVAPLYFYWMMPQPAATDISKFVAPTSGKAQEQVVTVQGKAISTPRLTRSKRAQFWFQATQLDEVTSGAGPAKVGQGVTGKLYVTVPLLQATGLHPNKAVAITGTLYKPKPAANPGNFDFQAYLAREGAFAGLQGRQIRFPNEQKSVPWGWWAIRQRIIRSQAGWLNIPEGPLVSAMVMGSQTVNLYLSAAIRDRFAQIGLAHAFAASGFQVSLILAIVLALTRRLSIRLQFVCGVTALLVFLGLTGPQPPVLRAVFMGIAVLFGLAMQRKIKPLGSLLAAATFLLIINPLWIRDLSFQLSFLATLGLLVTAPAIIKRLDWLPPLFAAAIAVPIAASVWTLPLQLYAFNVVSPYSILVNVITTPLITIISIGGFISAIAALLWPVAGSVLAWTLYYPTYWLMGLVEFFCQLPGNSVAVGSISALQLIALYGLLGWVWLRNWWHRHWWLAGLIATSLIVVPVWYAQANLFQVTMLSTSGEPILTIQEGGKVTLVNSGNANTARFTVLPFLQKQGVNKIDWAIDATAPRLTQPSNSQLNANRGWVTILERLPIETFYDRSRLTGDSTGESTTARAVQARQGTYYQSLPVGQAVQVGSTAIQLINPEASALQLQIQGQNWVLLGNLQPEQQKELATKGELPNTQVLAWYGQRLTADLLKRLKPAVAIILSASLDAETETTLRLNKTQFYATGRDGAVQWTPDGGFETTLEVTENNASLL